MKVLFDTDIYIGYLREGTDGGPFVEPFMTRYMSSVVLMELWAGASNARTGRAVQRLQTAYAECGRLANPGSAPVVQAGQLCADLPSGQRAIRTELLWSVYPIIMHFPLWPRDANLPRIQPQGAPMTALRTMVSAVALLTLASCSFLKPQVEPNKIGGTPSPMTRTGNTISLNQIKVGGVAYNAPSSMVVTKTSGDIATVKLTADLRAEPKLAIFNDWFPPDMKDSAGRINAEFDIKATSEGMQSYFKGDEPHTLVKYDAAVGDVYEIKRPDGQTYTRRVTEKTGADDFPYAGMYIKTIKVEQTATRAMGLAGITKVSYRANHRFGIVYLELQAEDGSTASTYLSSQIQN